MRVLLIGAAGQLGQALRQRLMPTADVVPATRTGRLADGTPCLGIDLARPREAVAELHRVAPHAVINAAAYTAVDRAEDEREGAFAINATAVGAVAAACHDAGIHLIHYSTDYVFDGAGSTPYRADDATAPLGVYGASKLAGERAVVESGARHLILRTAWVYGLYGSNFLQTMLRIGAERDELRVVADQFGSPTPSWLIADVTAAILRRGIGEGGVHHLVADGQTSWHGFAEAVFEEAVARGRLERAPRVLPITTSEYPTRARRPAYSVLDTHSLRELYGVELPHWRDALARTFDAAPRT